MNCSYSRPISGLSGGVPPDPPRRPPVRPPGRPAGKFPEIRGAEISAPRGAPPGAPPGPPWDPLWDPPPGTPFWDPPGALPGDPRGTPGGWSPPSNPPELGRLSCGPAWVPAGVQSARGALSGGPAAHLRRKCGIFAGPPPPRVPLHRRSGAEGGTTDKSEAPLRGSSPVGTRVAPDLGRHRAARGVPPP